VAAVKASKRAVSNHAGEASMPGPEWNSTTPPEEGAIVYVLALDQIGQYLVPFPVVLRDDSWWNARIGEELGAQPTMSNDDE
jgi:hypothetical protein